MNESNIRAGDVLRRPKALGIVNHFGVAVAPNLVLQNTPLKGEHLATLQEFSVRKPVTVHRSGANPSHVIARARTVLASPKRYDVFQNNCEHTATKIVQGVAKSPQLAALASIALVGGVLLLATKRS